MAGVRRTWDKKFYEAKAIQRLEEGDASNDASNISGQKRKKDELKEEFRKAESDADGPMGSQRAFIKSRQQKIDIDSKVGKTEVISAAEVERGGGGGYWCEVCACLLKDSASYLDHINGKKHQRALGFSMRVERADISKVKDRLSALKEKIEEKKARPFVSTMDSYESRIAAQLAEEEMKKKQRKELKEQKKVSERDIIELEEADPEIAEMMGFSGFGGSK